jgi:hypothetical protein
LTERIIDNAQSKNPVDIINIVPPKWNPKYNYDILSHIPAVMHVLFLGVTQTTGMTIKEVFVNYSKYSSFRADDCLKHLRGLSLDWCRIWTYGSEKTPYGPWVAENYLGYARIIKYVYSNSNIIIGDNNDNEDRKKSVLLIKQLSSALNAMISRIMQSTVSITLIKDTERHIKIFLQFMTMVDDRNMKMTQARKQRVNNGSTNADTTRKTKRKRRINTTSNLISLLDIPRFMEEFGPARLYWEGGYKGEGILRNVKPVVKQGTHMTWFATAAVKRFYNEKTISMLLDSIKNEHSDSTEIKKDITTYEDRKIYTYRGRVAQITEDIEQGKPISAAVCMENNIVYCVIINDNNEKK